MSTLRARILGRPQSRRPREAETVAAAVFTILRGRECWPGGNQPFNGQRARLHTVSRLVAQFEPDVFVETGTFIGSTTRFFCGNGVPVFTAEVKLAFWILARLRLGWGSEARVFLGDSRKMLRQLPAGKYERAFAYLDAHWWGDLPVTAELALLAEKCDEAIVAVDDFHVDEDAGYVGYEVNGRELSVRDVEVPAGAVMAFPAVHSADETGTRSGTLYVGWGSAAKGAIDALVSDGLLRYPRALQPMS